MFSNFLYQKFTFLSILFNRKEHGGKLKYGDKLVKSLCVWRNRNRRTRIIPLPDMSLFAWLKETPEQIDSAKSWTALNLWSTWIEFLVRVFWISFSNKDSIKPLEDLSSSYIALRAKFGVKEVFPQRATISIDVKEYLRVSHISIEWLSLENLDNLSCLPGKYILESTSENFSRFGVLSTWCKGIACRYLSFPTALAADCKSLSPRWRRSESVVLCTEPVLKTVDCLKGLCNFPDKVGKTQFASRRHTGQRNSPLKKEWKFKNGKEMEKESIEKS